MQDTNPFIVTPDLLVTEILRGSSNNNGDDEDPSSSLSKKKDHANNILILDCQPPSDFNLCHIKSAINITFPAIMIRRIQAGKIDLFDKSKDLKAKIANGKMTFIVYSYDDSSNDEDQVFSISNLVSKKLAQNNCKVAQIKGGLKQFRENYPEWIECSKSKNDTSSVVTTSSSSSNSPGNSSSSSSSSPNNLEISEIPLLGLRGLESLRILDEQNSIDSSIGLDQDDTPIEIMPYLFLGNAAISSDLTTLEKHNIKHVLNVTHNLPNFFQNEDPDSGGPAIRYLQIPISDHWTQSLLSYLPDAINFIDEGRKKEEGVLVHCLAGISRSVTVTLAYLMSSYNLSMNSAYDLVRSKKSNISPNFHFMGQLLDFERKLELRDSSQFLSPPGLGVSPDSGIEFDRWNNTEH